jgi:CRISPR/Cas system-associated endoribonuclease Cas2
MKITQQDLEEWKETEVGELFFKMLAAAAEKAKAHWVQQSWNSGVCNPAELAQLKARAEAFEQMKAVTATDIEEELDDQRERRYANTVSGSGEAG